MRDVPYLLINPPLTDPTSPYHALSYVSAAARGAGYEQGVCLDANIEALNFVAQPRHVRALLATAARIRQEAERRPQSPTRYQELRYRDALLALTLDDHDVERAIATMRTPDEFYSYPVYASAVDVLGRWIRLLPVDEAPGAYSRGFEVVQDGIFDLDDFRVLCAPDVAERIASPLRPYLDGPFADTLTSTLWRVIGLSVTYASQLPIALALARRVRKLAPDAVLVAGGTEISDLAKFCPSRAQLAQILEPFDVVVLGEGESAIVEILDVAADTRDRESAVGRLAASSRPGLHVVASLEEVAGKPLSEVTFEDLSTLAIPDYGRWDWGQYWSPENVILYSPTRGCYWNKCTFCDYGLNTSGPTSPSREVPPANLRRDLEALSAFGRTVYFAVDAMSPRYVRVLLETLEDLQKPVRWSAELRLEQNFPQRRLGRRLSEAGCVAISFGYESGTQRILDLIDKGVRLDVVPAVLEELWANDIGIQMMGFVGFPSETEDESLATYSFLDNTSDMWTIAGIGDFVLTSGSIIAKRPRDFGIELLPPPRDSISRMVSWRVEGEAETRLLSGRSPRVERAGRRIRRFAHDRPFVGGIDSAHSILYFSANGRQLVPSQERALHEVGQTWSYDSPLDSVCDYIAPGDIAEFREELGRSGEMWSSRAELWLAERRDVISGKGSRIGLTSRGAIFDESRMNQIRNAPRTRTLAAALFPQGHSG